MMNFVVAKAYLWSLIRSFVGQIAARHRFADRSAQVVPSLVEAARLHVSASPAAIDLESFAVDSSVAWQVLPVVWLEHRVLPIHRRSPSAAFLQEKCSAQSRTDSSPYPAQDQRGL